MAQPYVACPLIDDEIHVTEPKARMSAFLVVGIGTAKVLYEKEPQPTLRWAEVARIHRTQYGVVTHSTVEAPDEFDKEFLAAEPFVD